MIDLHCHLLPGLDDGPATLEEAVQLCGIAAADGVKHAITTPHIHPGRWDNNNRVIAQACGRLQQALDQECIPLRLGYAAEVRLSDHILKQLANNEIPFYGKVDGYHVMLLEFPHGHIIPGSDKLVAWLMRRNIRPLIAHPERNRQLMKNPNQLNPFIDAGCWLQVTAASILGGFGEGAQALAHRLLDEDAVTVIASDGHNSKARKPVINESFRYISKRYGQLRAEKLTMLTPAIIMADQF